ncbi:hypothetical protein [Catenuloplanes indicus]|uniref:Uncharacterized protein n=1 Tax=Catenuloplanes indicus TaxID=137267 RepID=A0AAE4B3L1_9ACTN|nr:hypothetical protein [Catenuloplanes indicus]MDQ0370263.1 hypothetical protein [Catenuloplanes indicus]
MAVRPWHLFGVIVAFGVGPAVWIGGSLVPQPASGTTPSPSASSTSASPTPTASAAPATADAAVQPTGVPGTWVPTANPAPTSAVPATPAATPATPAPPAGTPSPTRPPATGSPRPSWSIILPPIFPPPSTPPDDDAP